MGDVLTNTTDANNPVLMKSILSRTKRSGDCLVWTGGMHRDGYGRTRFSHSGKSWLVHRAAWFAWYGVDPGDLCVCHRCDVPSCVNPQHLFLGTKMDNWVDCQSKRRTAADNGTTDGERGHWSKMTNVQAREEFCAFRSGRTSAVDIARRYGMTRQSVWNMLKGKTWRRITCDLRSKAEKEVGR